MPVNASNAVATSIHRPAKIAVRIFEGMGDEYPGKALITFSFDGFTHNNVEDKALEVLRKHKLSLPAMTFCALSDDLFDLGFFVAKSCLINGCDTHLDVYLDRMEVDLFSNRRPAEMGLSL